MTTEKQRQTRMLRHLAPSSRVVATKWSGRPGTFGTVIDPHPFEADGVPRVRLLWDGADRVSHVLPSSIEEVDE